MQIFLIFLQTIQHLKCSSFFNLLFYVSVTSYFFKQMVGFPWLLDPDTCTRHASTRTEINLSNNFTGLTQRFNSGSAQVEMKYIRMIYGVSAAGILFHIW